MQFLNHRLYFSHITLIKKCLYVAVIKVRLVPHKVSSLQQACRSMQDSRSNNFFFPLEVHSKLLHQWILKSQAFKVMDELKPFKKTLQAYA